MMVTEAGLAVVCRHLLTSLHTGVRVSEGGTDAGVSIAELALRAHPGVFRLHYGELLTSTDTALRPHNGQVLRVTSQS